VEDAYPVAPRCCAPGFHVALPAFIFAAAVPVPVHIRGDLKFNPLSLSWGQHRFGILAFVMALFGPSVGHDALFDEVFKVCGVDRKLKPLLLSIIKKYRLVESALIFVEPDTLMHALNDPDFAKDNAELQKLYETWFLDKRKK
jgi:hypothetical protein